MSEPASVFFKFWYWNRALGAFSYWNLRETGPRIGRNRVCFWNGEPLSRINYAMSFLYATIFSQSFSWENWAMHVWNWLQTTLFQTKLLNASNPSSILINETSHSLNTDLTKAPSFFGTGNHAATLMDVNGKFMICTIRFRYWATVFLYFFQTFPDLEATMHDIKTMWVKE